MIIIGLLTLMYASWQFLMKKCFMCISLLCCNDKNSQVVARDEIATDSNFYNCISYVSLRHELITVQQSLEVYILMYRSKAFDEIYLSPAELKEYV